MGSVSFPFPSSVFQEVFAVKMVFAVVNNDDAQDVIRAMRKGGFYVTKLASTGTFLMKGNTTLISVVQNEQVDEVMSVIKEHSKKRKQLMPIDYSQFNPGVAPYPVEVTVGGAAIFVVDVEKFERA